MLYWGSWKNGVKIHLDWLSLIVDSVSVYLLAHSIYILKLNDSPHPICDITGQSIQSWGGLWGWTEVSNNLRYHRRQSESASVSGSIYFSCCTWVFTQWAKTQDACKLALPCISLLTGHTCPQIPNRSQLRHAGGQRRASQLVPADRGVPRHAGATIPHQHWQLHVPPVQHRQQSVQRGIPHSLRE